MRKEPLALYIFRFLMGFGLFAFMCLLYWSSTLIERDMKEVKAELRRVEQKLSNMQFTVAERQEVAQPKKRPHIRDDLPNMLEEDPFYAKTLPEMLGKDFTPQGTLHGAMVGKPINLHPFNNWADVVRWNRECTLTLATPKFGIYETLSPDMAIKMEERINEKTGKPEFWVHLRDDVYWEPLKQEYFPDDIELSSHFLKRHQVTAEDFKLYYDTVMNPHMQAPGAVAARTYLEDLEEMEVIDPHTLVVRWKTEGMRVQYRARFTTGGLHPLASFVYTHYSDGSKIIEDDNYRTNSVWAQQFMEHFAKNVIVSCGPWLFDGMGDRYIRFKRNPKFFEPLANLVRDRVVQFKESPEGVWQEFKSNKLDTYVLQPHQVSEFEEFRESPQYEQQKSPIERLDYIYGGYLYIGWNQARPLFASRKVRQAMTMAIDRQRIIQQNLNGMGLEITGTFPIQSAAYDKSIEPWPFDPQAARLLLEEDGWYDSDGDGVIDKEIDGERVPFVFNLTYYVKSTESKSVSEYIATALKEIGVVCQLMGVDLTDLSSVFDDKNFDAVFMGWGQGAPPYNPSQLWSSVGAKEKGSSNAIGFSNKEVDQIINDLVFEYDPKKRIALYHRFNQILHEEQPYTFLYTRKVALLYRDYLQNVFVPADRQDLIPGANWEEPQSSVYWIKENG